MFAANRIQGPFETESVGEFFFLPCPRPKTLAMTTPVAWVLPPEWI